MTQAHAHSRTLLSQGSTSVHTDPHMPSAIRGRLRGTLVIAATVLSAIRLVPHLIVDLLASGRHTRKADLDRWWKYYGTGNLPTRPARTAYLLSWYPEFRNLFYYRLGWRAMLLRPLCKPLDSLHLGGGSIGPGLFIQHGFATISLAKSIGANCWINQQVTIGYSEPSSRPIIGDNVRVYAGAKVLGGVRIGDNVIIGANCVVIRDVPDGVTVVGVPARIVRRDGRRVDEPL